MYKKILVPLDGSELSECSLAHVKTIALGCGVPEVILLRVVEPLFNPDAASDALAGKELIAQAEEENKAKAKDYMDALGERLGKEGILTQVVLLEGKPADEIMGFADKHGVDLIIMSTHGRSGITRWLLGSVAERVVRHSAVPVLTVSPAECRLSSADSH